jgi:hypothetical protein
MRHKNSFGHQRSKPRSKDQLRAEAELAFKNNPITKVAAETEEQRQAKKDADRDRAHNRASGILRK